MVAFDCLVKKKVDASEPRLRNLMDKVKAEASKLSPRGVATAFSASANLRKADASLSLAKALCEAADTLVVKFDARQIAMIFNALARLGLRDGVFIAFIEKRCRTAVTKMKEFEPQAISNIFNALAKLDHKDEKLLTAQDERF